MLLFCNVQHSSAWVNLCVSLLIDCILASSVPRATVRTLKPKKSKTLKTYKLGLYHAWCWCVGLRTLGLHTSMLWSLSHPEAQQQRSYKFMGCNICIAFATVCVTRVCVCRPSLTFQWRDFVVNSSQRQMATSTTLVFCDRSAPSGCCAKHKGASNTNHVLSRHH